MGVYEDWDAEVSRDEILERIEGLKITIGRYKDKEQLLEADLSSVLHEVSRDLLRDESDKMVRWIQSYQNEVARLNKLLSRQNEGFRISKYEVGI